MGEVTQKKSIVSEIFIEASDFFLRSAHKILSKKAKEGGAEAKYALAKFQLEHSGIGITAESCLEAARSGSVQARELLRHLHRLMLATYETTRGVQPDLSGVNFKLENLISRAADFEKHAQLIERRSIFLAKAENGNAGAQYELGLSYGNGLETAHNYIKPDYTEAVRWWREAGSQGDTRAQVNLAYMYTVGFTDVEKNEKEALKWWHKAADASHAGAQFELGQIHFENAWALKESSRSEAIQEMNEARRWWKKAGQQGHAEAQGWLGSCYDKNAGVFGMTLDHAESAKWYKMAAKKGVSFAQAALADMYADGIGLRQNWVEAVQWYRAAAGQGHITASQTLGHMYASGDVLAQDYLEAAKWWQLASKKYRWMNDHSCDPYYLNFNREDVMAWLCNEAANGLPLAIDMLDRICVSARKSHEEYMDPLKPGDYLDWGCDACQHPWTSRGYVSCLERDPEAKKALHKLADKGDTNAQWLLGFVLYDFFGHGNDESAQWLRMAVDSGHAIAQSILADMYSKGMGVVEDHLETKKLHQMAANQGDPESQYQLGLLKHSEGIKEWKMDTRGRDEFGRFIAPEEYFEAAQWYLKAARQGHAIAQNSLAKLYIEGRGVPKSCREAAKWRSQAAKQGYSEAQEKLADMYFSGAGLRQDKAKAVKWRCCAAEDGNESAQSSLSYAYFYGLSVRQDGAVAMKWRRLAQKSRL